MVSHLLAMRAGGGPGGRDDRSGNCSSLAIDNAGGSSYQRTGANRTESGHDLVRVVPLGGMPPLRQLCRSHTCGKPCERIPEIEDTSSGRGGGGEIAVVGDAGSAEMPWRPIHIGLLA